MEPVWLKSYPVDVDRSPAIPAVSLAEFIRDACVRHAEREAYWSMGRSMSFGETLRWAMRFGGWLRAQGIAPGDRVGVMLPNVLAFPVVTYGVLLAGCVVVNVNPQYTARELAIQIDDAQARILVVWEAAVPVVDEILAGSPLERCITVSPQSLLRGDAPGAGAGAGAGEGPPARDDRIGIPRWWSIEAVLASSDAAGLPSLCRDPTRPAFLQYTGGTTGVSKGAILTERNVLADLAQQLAWSRPYVTAQSGPHRLITALPLYHIAALMAGMFRRLADGSSCILIADARNVDALVETMRTQRFTMMGGVNTLYLALLSHPRVHEIDFSRCIICAAGATATQQAVVDRWFDLTGLSIIEGYGLTETCCYVSQQALDGRPFNGSVGLPFPLTDISVRDAQDREVGIGEFGEICVRGPQVMAGYWRRPADTAAVMTDDGFLRTGDIGTIDADGYLRLSDRKKDMILVSGFNVFPTEVEGVLLMHPKVREAAVIAVTDAHSGEAPAAFVVKRDASLTAEELDAHCEKLLTGYKRPRRYEFRETLPKSPVGKILRRALRDA